MQFLTIFLSFIFTFGSTNVYVEPKESIQPVKAVTHKPVDEVHVEENKPAFDFNHEEKDLLARLVHAEAKGEPYEGKVAVAKVVLNRLEHDEFPDSIEEVIYQRNAFEPVQNGSIHKPANEEAYQAVKEALIDEVDKHDDIVYFYNPDTATSDWIFSRQVVKTIGNHAFAI